MIQNLTIGETIEGISCVLEEDSKMLKTTIEIIKDNPDYLDNEICSATLSFIINSISIQSEKLHLISIGAQLNK